MNQARARDAFRFVSYTATAVDAQHMVSLAREAFSSSWTEDVVQWKYSSNPAGPGYGSYVELDGRLVGFYGAVPVRLRVGDRTVAAAQAADAMVLPPVRRRGLFGELGRRTLSQAHDAGAELVYAFPNDVSRVGSVKQMGFVYPGEVPRYVKVLAPGVLARESGRAGPGAWVYRFLLQLTRLAAHRQDSTPQRTGGVREVRVFDTRFADLWNEAGRIFPIAVVRDAAYLTWRYTDNPLVDYVVLVAEQDDTLRGYVVLSLRDLENDGSVALAELVVAPGEQEAGLALLAAAEARTRQLGGLQLQCWMLAQHTFYRSLLKRSGFAFWPVPFLPGVLRRETSFIVRSRSGGQLAPDPTRLENWFLSMGDQDYY
jgi:predicted N-acetyltransferase YhbS